MMADDSSAHKRSINARNLEVARLSRIGRALVEGPRALYPPTELDDLGWLEPDFRLLWTYPVYRGLESIIIYCDNTINRDDAFLDPVIRHARWQRREDFRLPDLPAWPTVDVSLSYFEAQRDWVSAQIATMQTALAGVPFIASGLITDRNPPPIVEDETRGWFQINSDNGVQTIEFRSPALPPPDSLTDLFFQVFSGLRDLVHPISHEGWTEAYDADPNFLVPKKSWHWGGKGQPPQKL